MAHLEIAVLLLTCAVALGWLARQLSVPYPIALVLGGLALGLVPHLPRVAVEPNLILVIVLPPVLYQAAIFTSIRDFRRSAGDISFLAIGLVLATTAAVGITAHLLIPEMPLAAGFVLGAIVSPPDAIAATAILSRLKMPRRLVTILEGESLVNDASGLVLYKFAVAAVVTGAFSLGGASLQFAVVAIGGVALGAAIGWLSVVIHRRLADPPIEIALSLAIPFLAYLAAEQLHLSGVLAVVAAGLVRGWHAPEAFSAQTRMQAYTFWQTIVFVLNSFVFVLIGLELSRAFAGLSDYSLLTLLGYGAAISAVAVAVRLVMIFPGAWLPRLIRRRRSDPLPPWRQVLIVGWSGMRGIVSVAAALALPLMVMDGSAFPQRDMIVFLTFCVIFVTLVLQGLTLSPLICGLGVGEDTAFDREERIARLKTTHAAIQEVSRVAEAEGIPAALAEHVRQDYDTALRYLKALDPATSSEHQAARRLRLAAIAAKRRRLIKLRRDFFIGDEVLLRIQRELDLEEIRLS